MVRIARENESEQSFYLLIEAVVASPSPSIAPVSNKFAHNVLTSNSRVILQVSTSFLSILVQLFNCLFNFTCLAIVIIKNYNLVCTTCVL